MDVIGTAIAKHRLSRGTKAISGAWMGRPFAAKTQRKVVFFHEPRRICYAQLYPFFHYRAEFLDRFGVQFRALPINAMLSGQFGCASDADDILIQPWFRVAPDELARACDALVAANPTANLTFLDSFAHNDVRLAAALPDTLKFYLKKSLYVDQTHYRTCYGDTFMSQYYADMYGLEPDPKADFRAPDHILPKLRLSPNFFTAPHLMDGFAKPDPPRQAGRSLDIQLRLGRKGSPWYAKMRQTSQDMIEGMAGISRSGTGPLPLKVFNAELNNARLCFSPFGYGELCWRDIEAMQAGSVVIKQDMGHLQTLPDLYEPWVTYLPVKWDFSDLEEVLRSALADPDRLQRVADSAYQRIRHYITQNRFVDDMSFLFKD